MNHTTNYNLNQWEADDRVTREDFNADNAKIDAALAALADAAGGAAKVATGRYNGTGEYGTAHKNSLTFDFEPYLVLVGCQSNCYSNYLVMLRDCPVAMFSPGGTSPVYLTWSGNTITWYSAVNATNQCSTYSPYYYIAIG